jgi:Ca2+-transporting ATPase
MAASGLRVLAMAYGPTLDDLIFVGLIGMEDPPRDGVADAVRQLRCGGVKVLMLTGDSKETALVIARRCGIYGEEHDAHVASFSPGSTLLDESFESEQTAGMEDVELGASIAMSGEELDSLPPNLLADSIVGVRIFYRVVPRHKLALIRALQSHGEIVAMTGKFKKHSVSKCPCTF